MSASNHNSPRLFDTMLNPNAKPFRPGINNSFTPWFAGGATSMPSAAEMDEQEQLRGEQIALGYSRLAASNSEDWPAYDYRPQHYVQEETTAGEWHGHVDVCNGDWQAQCHHQDPPNTYSEDSVQFDYYWPAFDRPQYDQEQTASWHQQGRPSTTVLESAWYTGQCHYQQNTHDYISSSWSPYIQPLYDHMQTAHVHQEAAWSDIHQRPQHQHRSSFTNEQASLSETTDADETTNDDQEEIETTVVQEEEERSLSSFVLPVVESDEQEQELNSSHDDDDSSSSSDWDSDIAATIPWGDNAVRGARYLDRTLSETEVLTLPEIDYLPQRKDQNEARSSTTGSNNYYNALLWEEEDDEDDKKNEYQATSCTTCAICLEDFVKGEKIRLLPRCNHAFHTEHILPWLTTVRGCCPLCKTRVANDEEPSTSEDHPFNPPIAIDTDEDDDVARSPIYPFRLPLITAWQVSAWPSFYILPTLQSRHLQSRHLDSLNLLPPSRRRDGPPRDDDESNDDDAVPSIRIRDLLWDPPQPPSTTTHNRRFQRRMRNRELRRVHPPTRNGNRRHSAARRGR